MNAIEFYNYSKQILERDAEFYGVDNLDRYFQLTDLRDGRINSLGEGTIQQAYAQFAAHLQNGTLIDKIVKFWKKFDFLKDVFCGFNPSAVLASWQGREDELVEALRYNEVTNPNGLKWTTEKSKKKDAIIKRFVGGMIKGAEYFASKANKQEVIDDLMQHNNNYKELIEYFMSKVSGMNIALVCDFLKEFAYEFDLPKPDVHLMDTMAKLTGCQRKDYENKKDGYYKCMEDFNKLLNEIRAGGIEISAYNLDRMIWMNCAEPSRRYFLDEDRNFGAKERYLNF
jgi:thermostable 8-oxoguanine DNA glycosylase